MSFRTLLPLKKKRNVKFSAMKIKVNNDFFELQERDSLISLMTQLSMEEKKGIAVAVNAEVIPKKQWQQFELNDNDEVIIIQATQGG